MMREAIIHRRGLAGSALDNAINNAINNALPITLKTEIITENKTSVVPAGIINNEVFVWIFGAGCGGSYGIGDGERGRVNLYCGGGGGITNQNGGNGICIVQYYIRS